MANVAQIQQEIQSGPYYQQNFANDGERFVAWYLQHRDASRFHRSTRRHNRPPKTTSRSTPVIVDDDERRVFIIQGKFITASGTHSQ